MAPKRTTKANPTTTTATTSVTNDQLKEMINQGITDALAVHDADRNMNGDDNHNSGTGTEGVVELIQWFEKMETVFSISNCSVENQIKFSTCTLLVGALTCIKAKTMQEAIEIATELIDKKIRTFAERQTENKRKQDDNQQQNKGRTHVRPTLQICAPNARSANIVGHLADDEGHFKRDCPKLKSNNHGNQGGNGNALAKVYAVGRAGTNPNANVVTVHPSKQRNVAVLFDTGSL
ncbi:hypothetical protein Tco_1068721 [Tanacetum coccineum]|uniref:Reverse transcriptase domain-containing protein n=1 Tax=Tanacetum coccineum TaxID=301880 RepID=A0ABQ5HHJ0_9ASTR